MTILLIAMGCTMGVYLAALKRVVHAQNALTGTTELRHTSDLVSEAVRSAPQVVTVQASGTQLLVAPKDLGYATVLETTWIDTLHNVKGSRSNQRMLHISNVVPAAVTASIFASAARPAGTVAASDVASYFTNASSLPGTDLNDLFSVGDTITIPATAYGPQTTATINSISNNPGSKTLTTNADLGVDVPNGTRIAASAGRRMLFSVEANGELRYYADHRNLATYTVLARDIDPSPLTNPANLSSGNTVPFSLSGRYLTLNLQKLPRGTTAGRTVQGVQTTVFTRSDPLIP